MISFPFGYCGGFKEARVNFKYPTSDWDVIVSQKPPVLYRTEIIQTQNAPLGGMGQCPVNYEVKVRVYRRSGGYDSISTPSNCASGFFGPIQGLVFDRPTATSFRMGIAGRDRNGNPLTLYRFSAGGSPDDWEFTITSIRRCDNQPDNCGTTEPRCKFTVTDKTGIIYDRTESECPQVTVDCGKKCPPNTCECRNGMFVCCYDSNGYVIARFEG